ncbi:RNA recognition motif containing protein [Cordyceps javanica]|uniref:RNA recognition motif containing protein n=1 Tax=Cordyceps javanica TaxID=43265 RepID=A0A545VEE6_9HYPO|nr:RNA recognition motif containing protein [Cordyceps javanica]
MSLPLHRSQIRIDRSEYDRLLIVASKYENLCQHLIRGGIDADILSKNYGPGNHENDSLNSHVSPDDGYADSSRTSTIVNYRGGSYSAGGSVFVVNTQSGLIASENGSESEFFVESISSNDQGSLSPNDPASVVATRHSYEPNARRTLQLGNLPPQTSLADIVSVVRGGPIVDIYLNIKKMQAVVSFVHGEHSWKYYNYAQETGVCIRGSVVSPYVCQQLRGGASRNLVVRHYDRRITADSIRADLEHIHNLSVIGIEFSGLDCYIGINSITAASFARTCMMSLYSPYRGSRIEWAPDECMQSLAELKSKTSVHTPVDLAKANTNRFSLLDVNREQDN